MNEQNEKNTTEVYNNDDDYRHSSTSDTHSNKSMVVYGINSSQCEHIIYSEPVSAINLSETKDITVTDIIGEFGLYQCSLSIITFIRYVCVAMMTNTGPLIAPDMDYYCILPDSLTNILNKNGTIYLENHLKNACQVWIPPWTIIDDFTNKSKTILTENNTYNCINWTYNTSQVGRTMTDEFNLVCDRDWLRSLFQSSVSIGVVLASLFWGTLSDKRGRYYTMKMCYIVSFISGSISFLAPNFMIYVTARSVCSLGDLGLVVSLATILVESVGNQYRGAVCIVVYLGWAIGVMIMPWITNYFKDFRLLMLATIVLHIITLPWLLLKDESVRWLLINNNFSEALIEVKRIVQWNKCLGLHQTTQEHKSTDDKFEQLRLRFKLDSNDESEHNDTDHPIESSAFIKCSDKKNVGCDANCEHEFQRTDVAIKVVACDKSSQSIADETRKHGIDDNQDSLLASLGKVRQLFQSRELSITTLTLVWVTFNSELLYMSFILINSDVGDNLYANYAMGGLMEILAALISCVIISNVTRRLSLTLSLLCISVICFTLAFVYEDAKLVLWLLSAAKLAISTLSSLVYVTAIEMFPTDLRQTGSGACATFGSMGAVVAPFICSQLVNVIGMNYVLALFSISSTTAALLIPFFLRETKGVELTDKLDEL